MDHRILLVEDDEEMQGLFCYAMKRYPDLDVVVCDSPSQAIEAFERAQAEGCPFHLIFTERWFPEESGFTVARLLGAHAPVFMFVSDPNYMYEQYGTDLTRYGVRDLIRKVYWYRKIKELIPMVTGKEMLPLNHERNTTK